MLITPMRRRGIVPTPQERRQSLAVKGDVRYGQSDQSCRGKTGSGMHDHSLPPLHDARRSGMVTLGFVLSGFEVIDGCAYAQSWWFRLE